MTTVLKALINSDVHATMRVPVAPETSRDVSTTSPASSYADAIDQHQQGTHAKAECRRISRQPARLDPLDPPRTGASSPSSSYREP